MEQERKEMVLLVLWYVREWDDDVLVDKDEQREEETQPDRAQCVHSRQLIKRREVEDGAAVDAEYRNWWEQRIYRKHLIETHQRELKRIARTTW